jgi:transcriptional regulator with XRE-family HTH domain
MPSTARRGPYLTPPDILAERSPLARELLRRRVDRQLTQRDLATKSGVHEVLISAYECGRLVPGPTNRRRLMEALGWR